jgi:hypothetical protein
MKEIKNKSYRHFLVRNHERHRSIGRHRPGYDDNIKIDFRGKRIWGSGLKSADSG